MSYQGDIEHNKGQLLKTLIRPLGDKTPWKELLDLGGAGLCNKLLILKLRMTSKALKLIDVPGINYVISDMINFKRAMELHDSKSCSGM